MTNKNSEKRNKLENKNSYHLCYSFHHFRLTPESKLNYES